MDKDTLIAQQALEIATLKEQLASFKDCCERIHMECVGIGGPLNDNVLGYSGEQKAPFLRINQWASLNI